MDRGELDITAELARLKLDESQMKAFEASLDQLLEHLRAMSAFDVEGLEPTTHAAILGNRLRPDEAAPPSEMPDLLLEQAPDLEDRFISIPNVL